MNSNFVKSIIPKRIPKNYIMKSPFKSRNLFLSLSLFAAVIVSLNSCNKKEKTDTEEVAEEYNDAKFKDSKKMDSQFLVEAASMDLQDIQLGKLAQKSINPKVKNHGRMMDEEHTKLFNELKMLAEQKQITIPMSVTAEGMEAYNVLNDKKSEDFDKAYASMILENHKDAVDKFELIVNETDDAEIKAWATSTLESLRNHLDHTLTMQKEIAK